MSEIAVVTARKSRLQDLANKGNSKAKVALELANAPNQFLSTVQIGITLVGILAGAYGGRTIADRLAASLSMIPAIEPYSGGWPGRGRYRNHLPFAGRGRIGGQAVRLGSS